MSWLDQLQPASFRGVSFQVDDISHWAGDTVVVREYPFQDLPTVFRMGEAAEEIKFSAYVIGDDYIEHREALREVLTGEGVLVHPTAGSIRVYVAGRFAIKENPTYEGGVARFDLTFIRAETRRYPTGVTNTEGEAVDAADTATDAAEDQFASEFDLDGLPGWVADSASTSMRSTLDAVWGQVGELASSLGSLGALGTPALLGSLDSLASMGPLGSLRSLAASGALGSLGDLSMLADFGNELMGSYQAMSRGFEDLLREPRELAGAMRGLFDMPVQLPQPLAGRYQAAFSGLFVMPPLLRRDAIEVSIVPEVGAGLVMFGRGDPTFLGTDGAARAQLARMNAVSDQFVETLATAAYVRATAGFDLSASDYDTVMAMRRTANAQCTRLLVEASTRQAPATLPATEWHAAVAALQTAALKDLQARSRDVVRLTDYTPKAWQPVWYISYFLYGTAAYADEILTLNPHIEHPLLVPPGKALRVMRHD